MRRDNPRESSSRLLFAIQTNDDIALATRLACLIFNNEKDSETFCNLFRLSRIDRTSFESYFQSTREAALSAMFSAGAKDYPKMEEFFATFLQRKLGPARSKKSRASWDKSAYEEAGQLFRSLLRKGHGSVSFKTVQAFWGKVGHGAPNVSALDATRGRDAARVLIANYLKLHGPHCMVDIADALDLDFNLVIDICRDFVKKGQVEIDVDEDLEYPPGSRED